MKTNQFKNASLKEERWLQLLLNEDSSEEFSEIYDNSCSMLFALCKYKSMLRHRGRGSVSFTTIKRHYEENNFNELHKCLNELFLEYYTKEEIEYFLLLMKETNTTIEEMYDRHNKHPEWTILSTLTL